LKKLIIFGLTEMSKIATYYFEKDSDYEVVAYTVEAAYKEFDSFLDKPVYVFETLEQQFPPEYYELFVAIGPTQMSGIRKKICLAAKGKGYILASYVSSRAVCNSTIGENSFIADMAVVNPYVEIGMGNYIWEYCYVGNDSKIGNFNYFAPHSVVGTYCEIQDQVILGMGAVVNTRIVVRNESMIGASCYISKDTKESGVYGEKSSKLYMTGSDRINITERRLADE